MDGFNLQMPVTLVVKAPNQKIQDHTVECGWEWTIRKLKEHLSDVYPSKPRENQQKLIYSGKLLQDHQTLKDVLRQYDRNQTTHTVHLVCSQVPQELPSSQTESKPNSVPSHSAQESEGLRHRRVQSQPPASVPTEPATQPVHSQPVAQPAYAQPFSQPAQPTQLDVNTMQQMFAANPMLYGSYYPGMMAMTPEQLAWMQQMYTQQMNCFLQMYQGSYVTPPASPAMPGSPVPQTPPPQPAQQANQPIRMNAQGGMAVDEEEGEEGRHRDWLDYLYTFSRFSVLLSIVYFYSTISRFVLVFTFFLFFYLYQGGWFHLNRPERQQQQQPQQQQQEQQQQQPQQQQQQQPQQQEEQNNDQAPNEQPAADRNTEEESGGETDRSEEESQGGSTEPSTPLPPAQPSGAQVAWNFFTSFFSSLVPQQPPPVNAN